MAIKMFISYSSDDIRFVEKLELLLARKFKNKIEPVLSAQQKEIGGDIPKKILGHIEECKWFSGLLTRNSIINPTVTHELGYANALLKSGIITRIIPIVERVKDTSGKYVPIDTGVFFDRNIESAKYIAEEDKWDECISDLSEYLDRAYEKELKPEHEVLEEQAKQLSEHGYDWEAAEKLKESGRALINQIKIKEGIDNYHKSIELYVKSEHYWEAAQQYNTIAKILEKSYEPHEAANEYRLKGDLLSENEDEYTWEAAQSFVKAGGLYEKVGNLDNARFCYLKAIKLFEANGDDSEADKIRKRLRKVLGG